MLYLFRLFLIIDQETVLNWFGVEDRANQEISQAAGNGYALNLSNLEPSTDVSLTTLIVEGLWDKIQDGLTLLILKTFYFSLFLFVSLYLHYGIIKNFFLYYMYRTFAGYLWYKHLIDLISMYRSVLLKLPF
jgi:hypothetical protein